MTDPHPLVKSGARIAVRATPRAARDRIDLAATPIRVWVTAVPEDGKANEAIRKLLAKSLGIAKSRLTLIAGHVARDKVFEID